jgi:predicted acyl esterase
MRRIVVPFLMTLLLASAFAGCLGNATPEAKAASARQLGGKVSGAKAVLPGTYKFDGRYSQVLVEGPYKALNPVHLLIKAKDGVDIEIGYWLPDVPEGTKVPVLVHASPYHRPAGAVTKLAGTKLFLVDNFLPYGYAVAAVAVRGTADSGGCMDLMGKKEVSDLDTAITWLATQPWSNGNVGMTGVSYDGSTPWSVAATGNPHLKTIVPISGVPDVYGLMFRNGSAETRGPFLLNYLYYTYGWEPAVNGPNGPIQDPIAGGDANRTATHRVEGINCPESLEGFAWAAYSGTYGERDPQGWWAERNRKPLVEKNYKGSILSVQGLQDWNVDPSMVIPWVDQLNQTGVFTHQLLGQWPHANPDRLVQGKTQPPTRWDWAEQLLHWFDYWLKDMHNIDLGPAVQVQDSRYQWRVEETFPPRDATWMTYHLATGNALKLEAGPGGSVLLGPQAAAEAAPGPLQQATGGFRSLPGYKADFSTAPFDKPMQVSGLPRLHVTVTPSGTTGHLSAWLYDVDPSGKELRIGWTTMNLMFADGSEKAKPLMPNVPLLAKIQFQPLDAAVPAGHKLLVRVWEFQDNDRLPAIPPEPVTLNFGGSAKSTLEVPFVERAPSAFFMPPYPAEFKMPEPQ